MKYVRTQDGIFRIDNDKISVINGCQFVRIRGCILHSLDVKDKVADTIKELVDGYYVDIDNRHFDLTETYDRFELAKDSEKDWQSYSNRKELEYEIIVYAFIKTDKGLIYVAKINDKGELELL